MWFWWARRTEQRTLKILANNENMVKSNSLLPLSRYLSKEHLPGEGGGEEDV